MKTCIRVLSGIWLALLLVGDAASAPFPSVPGEVLVQVRVPTISRNKSGKPAYDLPPRIRKNLESEGLSSARPLTNPVGPNKSVNAGSAGPQGVFLLKFNGKQPVADLVAKAEALPGIAIAEPNYVGALCAAPSDEFYVSNQKAVLDRMGFEEAWDFSTGSPDTVIAVLDSGIDTTHPDFADRLLPGYNFISDSTDVYDPLGHGTRVAGILGARGGDSGPGSGMTGICWDCRLLPVVVAGIDRAVTVADLIEAINYSVDQGADVINMSLAIGGESKLLENACRAAAEQAILVAAAGNQGQNFVPLFPAGYEGVIGVASLDAEGNRSAFSNYNLPGVNEFVDFAAPGEGVFTTIPAWLYDSERTNGTSFAAPFVTGTAALLRSLYPEQSPGAIRAHLERHVQPVGNIVAKGLPDAGGALSSPLEPILRVASVTIRDGTDLNPANDADSALDGGETAEIVVELENLGADLQSFVATLSTSETNVTISQSSFSSPAITHGKKSKNVTSPFRVEVTEGAPQTDVTFQVQAPGGAHATFETAIENEAAVPQNITSDLTLMPDHTWIVSGVTTVATGATLMAKPGTTVKLEDTARLEVWGGLSSVGAGERPIRWQNRTPPPVSIFAPSREYPVGDWPHSIIAQDVTGDGLTDLVTANHFSDDVSVLAGDGAGGFLPQIRYPVGSGPQTLIAEDVTGDGITDLVTANLGFSDVSVLKGNGVGGFRAPIRYPVGENPVGLIARDVTGDGITDLVTANYWSRDVSVLAGDGAGGFLLEIRYPVPGFRYPNSSSEVLIADDVTGDGVLDLVTANYYDDDVSVLSGDGAGGFLPQTRYPVGGDPVTVIAQDVTGDGVIDLITAGRFYPHVCVLAGDGAGGFGPQETYPVGYWPVTLIAADVTGDGFTDLVTANDSDGDVSVLAGDGAGGFLPEVRFQAGDYPQTVIAVDVTADGFTDLVTANRGVYDNDCVCSVGGDVSVLVGDGVGRFRPQISFSVGRSPKTIIVQDLTGDGLMDLVGADLDSDSDVVSFLVGVGADGFRPQIEHPVGREPVTVMGKDVTGDGITDLVTANSYSNNVSVLVGDGAGGFLPDVQYRVGGYPISVIAADVTGDGLMDLITANNYNQFNNESVSVLTGDGVGGFLPEIRFPVGDGPESVISMDVTGDGLTDLVTANSGSNDVSVLAGDGAGGFQPQVKYSVGTSPQTVIGLDVTGDGVTDLVTANLYSYDVSVLAGDGVGGFLPESRYQVGVYPVIVIAQDVTGDGITDLVTANSRGDNVSVLAGDGAGGFFQEIRLQVGDTPQTVITKDVTGDGHTDLVTANWGSHDVSVLTGDGAGGFLQQVRYPVGDSPQTVIAADVTSDGHTDLVTVNYNSRSLSVLTGDGAGGFLPETMYQVGTFPVTVIAQDVTGDDITDLVTVNWGSHDVSVLWGDGVGGFGNPHSLTFRPLSDGRFSHTDVTLPGPVLLQGTGEISNCQFTSSWGTGLAVLGNVTVRDSTAEFCFNGFAFSMKTPPPVGLSSLNNRVAGMLLGDAFSCVAIGNGRSGVQSLGSLANCRADLNNGTGLFARGSIQDSISIRNTGHGISARVVENSLAAGNSVVGIVATEMVSDSLAINNGQGIQAPILENSQVIGTFGSALAGGDTVNDSALLENASISSDTIQFNNTILAGNAESATLDLIDGMYIAGNEGGGVRGVAVTNSTIIGNKGPGVDQNVMVTDSNIAFNEGPGVVGGEVANVFALGNRDGELTAGAIGILSAEPVQDAPAFLSNVQINLATITLEPTQTLGVGRAEFMLTYSKDMDTARRLWVTFGQSSPFTAFIASASPGWTDSRTWKGYFDVGGEVGSGAHTLRVSGARALPDALFPDGFEIPPDTYHRFLVDTELGLAISNGRIVGRGENSLTLAWDPSKDLTPLGFSVVRSRTGREFQHVATLPMDSTQFLDDGLAPNTTYYYQVYESVSRNSHRQLTNPFSGTTGDPFTPTPTGTNTPTPSATPTPTETQTPCSPQDLSPDCRIDARDLLVLIQNMKAQEGDQESLFGFAQSWMNHVDAK